MKKKECNYDFERQMEGATKLKCQSSEQSYREYVGNHHNERGRFRLNRPLFFMPNRMSGIPLDLRLYGRDARQISATTTATEYLKFGQPGSG